MGRWNADTRLQRASLCESASHLTEPTSGHTHQSSTAPRATRNPQAASRAVEADHALGGEASRAGDMLDHAEFPAVSARPSTPHLDTQPIEKIGDPESI